MLHSTHPSVAAEGLSQVSVFLCGVFFELVLDVLDEFFHKGSITLEELGNLPVLNSKRRWQHRDASPDADLNIDSSFIILPAAGFGARGAGGLC